MSIQHAGGTIVNTTFTGDTKAAIADGIKAALVTAGWSVASGATGDWKLNSATSPQGLQLRVRLWDGVAAPTSTNCAQIRIMNVGETVTPAMSNYLLPGASKTFRVVANCYQAFVFVPGSTAARDFSAFGLPYLPAHIATPTAGCIYEAGWLTGNAVNDGDATVRTSFRTELQCEGGGGSCFQNGGAVSVVDGAHYAPGGLRLLLPFGDPSNSADNLVQWHDGSYFIGDAVLAWGDGPSYTTKSKARGQIWGAFVDSADRTADTVFSFDDGAGSHDYMVITSSNTGAGRGTLCVAVT